MNNMRKILIIDGDYFAHRAISTLNKGDEINNLETNNEQENFKICLNQQLHSLVQNTKHIFNNYIFVRDNSSWRKKVEPHIPYYSNNLEKKIFGYKENRKEKKEASTINDDNYRKIYREFTDNLKNRMMVFDIKNLEGDDNIYLLSQKLLQDELLKNTIFCAFGTDIDCTQSVVGNFIMFRNISSKDCPNGEVVISQKLKERFFSEKDKKVGVNQLLVKQDEALKHFNEVFTMNIFSKTKIERTIENLGIKVSEPMKLAFEKMFAGDDKDNVFSILGWKSKTGTRNYALTENKLIDAFNELHNNNIDIVFNCETCKEILSSKELIEKYTKILIKQTKQDDSKYDSIIKNLKHNMRLKLLSKQTIPSELIAEFDVCFNQYIREILNNDFDVDKVFKNVRITRADSAVRLLEDSLPDELRNVSL